MNNWVLFCYILKGLIDTIPIGFQRWVFRVLEVGESITNVGKIQMLDLGSKPFAPQGKAGSSGSAADCMALGHWVLPSVSAFPRHFDVGGCAVICPMCRSHSTSF